MEGGLSVTRAAASRNPISPSSEWDLKLLLVSIFCRKSKLCFVCDLLLLDWECPKCSNLNYARRDRCNRNDCDFEKKDLEGEAGRSLFEQDGAGEWECPRCKNLNFNNRNVCNGQLDGELCGLAKPDFDKWGVKPVRDNRATGTGRRPGDWDCWRYTRTMVKYEMVIPLVLSDVVTSTSL